MPTIKQNYIDTGLIRYVFRHFPLRSIHANAENAARASECANDQGSFWEYKDELFDNQDNLTANDLQRYATNVGLDRPTFDPCAGSDQKAFRVQQDVNSGMALGVSSTPTFFVDNEMLSGFRSAAQLGAAIDRHLP